VLLPHAGAESGCRCHGPHVQGRGACPMPVRTFGVEAAQTVSPRNSTSSLAWCVSPDRLKLAKPVRKRRPSMMLNPSHIEARPLSEDQGFALFYPYCRPTRPLSARRTKSLGDIPMLGSPNLPRRSPFLNRAEPCQGHHCLDCRRKCSLSFSPYPLPLA
jgi:hypothetical protein